MKLATEWFQKSRQSYGAGNRGASSNMRASRNRDKNRGLATEGQHKSDRSILKWGGGVRAGGRKLTTEGLRECGKRKGQG